MEDPGCSSPPDGAGPCRCEAVRARQLQRALTLEYVTVGWNVVEGVIAVAAALSADSIALLGFGIDSFVECASGGILIWRLKAERSDHSPGQVDQLDRRARRLVGLSLFLLAGYVGVEAISTLITLERPRPSWVGIALLVVSMGVMRWLARAKQRAASELSSEALAADSFQTTACFWLSVIGLSGIAVNAALGWWWADPVAALVMSWFIVREGREAWRGQTCGCH
ncbi:MAG: cation transporter [Candidatus Riflebacteria bacterium]|nr:cation transporter [Candidatus Riflebacteria bacterium]